jgi:hypothetical protein
MQRYEEIAHEIYKLEEHIHSVKLDWLANTFNPKRTKDKLRSTCHTVVYICYLIDRFTGKK